ncbi:MAG TPA: shikimate dehydrogenase [Solirubrobacteraceae bacterium]|nr:shikimate dehydrogenase [Solirubrobacteraceae bacterium]
MARLGVFGWPVAHSRSPAIHNAAFAALGMEGWRYQLLPVPPRLFGEVARALGGSGFLGANVTIPHKEAALAVAERASAEARAIGAANMLTVEDGVLHADNTDAPGLRSALGASPAGMRVLILGAGGSARAAVFAMREAGASDVAVWNRTPARAEALARELGVRAIAAPEPADVLVNCTSVGLHASSSGAQSSRAEATRGSLKLQPSASELEELNQLSLTFDLVGEYSHVVDLAYRSPPTALVRAARSHGVHAVEGLDVLVAQGALSFERWTGRHAPADVMRAAAAG